MLHQEITRLEEVVRIKRKEIENRKKDSYVNDKKVTLKKEIEEIYLKYPFINEDVSNFFSINKSQPMSNDALNKLKGLKSKVEYFKAETKAHSKGYEATSNELEIIKYEMFFVEDSIKNGYTLPDIDFTSLTKSKQELNNIFSSLDIPQDAKQRLSKFKIKVENERNQEGYNFNKIKNDLDNLISKFDELSKSTNYLSGSKDSYKIEELKNRSLNWKDNSLKSSETRQFIQKISGISGFNNGDITQALEENEPTQFNKFQTINKVTHPSVPVETKVPIKPTLIKNNNSYTSTTNVETKIPIKPMPIKNYNTSISTTKSDIKLNEDGYKNSNNKPINETKVEDKDNNNFDIFSDREAIAEASKKAREKAKMFEKATSSSIPKRPSSPKPKPKNINNHYTKPSISNSIISDSLIKEKEKEKEELIKKKQKEESLREKLNVQNEVKETTLDDVKEAARKARSHFQSTTTSINQNSNKIEMKKETKLPPPVKVKPSFLSNSVNKSFKKEDQVKTNNLSSTINDHYKPVESKPAEIINSIPNKVSNYLEKETDKEVNKLSNFNKGVIELNNTGELKIEKEKEFNIIKDDYQVQLPEEDIISNEVDNNESLPDSSINDTSIQEPTTPIDVILEDTTINNNIKLPSLEEPWIIKSLYDYSDDHGIELGTSAVEFKANQLIYITNISEDNTEWCMGYLDNRDNLCWIPTSYLDIPKEFNDVMHFNNNDKDNIISEETIQDNVISDEIIQDNEIEVNVLFATLLCDWEAEIEGNDTMMFEKGLNVEIIDTSNPDWYLVKHPNNQILAYLPADQLYFEQNNNTDNPFFGLTNQNHSNSNLDYDEQNFNSDSENYKLSLPKSDSLRKVQSNQSLSNYDYNEDLDRMCSPHRQGWASQVGSNSLLNLTEKEIKRRETIHELVATEKTYLRDMQLVINLFLNPLQNQLSQEELKLIFSNLSTVVMINTLFLSELEAITNNIDNDTCIGEVYLSHSDQFNCYAEYCGNQAASSRHIQNKSQYDPNFASFLKNASFNPECRMLSLNSFLLEPVQRITRYPLLLKQTLKYTEEHHPDYEALKKAIIKSETMLEDINKSAQASENAQQLLELSKAIDFNSYPNFKLNGLTQNLGPRQAIMNGPINKHKSGRLLHGFLFNDLFLLTQPIGSTSNPQRYTLYNPPMPLARLKVRDAQTSQGRRGIFSPYDDTCFQIVHVKDVITLKAATPSTKKKWISEINKAINLAQQAGRITRF